MERSCTREGEVDGSIIISIVPAEYVRTIAEGHRYGRVSVDGHRRSIRRVARSTVGVGRSNVGRVVYVDTSLVSDIVGLTAETAKYVAYIFHIVNRSIYPLDEGTGLVVGILNTTAYSSIEVNLTAFAHISR